MDFHDLFCYYPKCHVLAKHVRAKQCYFTFDIYAIMERIKIQFGNIFNIKNKRLDKMFTG